MFYINNKFSPHFLTTSASSGLIAWYNSSWPDLLLESGTESDIRRIQSVDNLAFAGTGKPGLGGAFQQTTSANRPVNASFPEGRAAYFDGSNDSEQYDGAAGDLKCLHDGTGSTVFAVFRSPNVANSTMCMFGTHTPLAASVGTSFRTLTNGTLRVNISDGTSLDAYDSAIGVIQSNTTHVACMRHSSSETNVINVRVDGTQVINATSYTAITPSSSDPSAALVVGARGDSGNPFLGYIPEVIIYNRYLSDAEVAQVESYLSRWTMEVTYDQIITQASLWDLIAFLHSNGSAWVDRLGNYTPTEVGSPTHTTSASFNSKNVMRLNGSTQYAHYDALASQFSGNDTPISVISCHELDNLTGVFDFFSMGGSVSADEVRLSSTANPDYRAAKRDGSGTTTQNAGIASTSAEIVAMALRQTAGSGVVSMYLDATSLVQEATLERDSIALDRATTGALVSTAASKFTPGDFGAQLISNRYLNTGDYLAIQYALATEFGL